MFNEHDHLHLILYFFQFKIEIIKQYKSLQITVSNILRFIRPIQYNEDYQKWQNILFLKKIRAIKPVIKHLQKTQI